MTQEKVPPKLLREIDARLCLLDEAGPNYWKRDFENDISEGRFTRALSWVKSQSRVRSPMDEELCLPLLKKIMESTREHPPEFRSWIELNRFLLRRKWISSWVSPESGLLCGRLVQYTTLPAHDAFVSLASMGVDMTGQWDERRLIGSKDRKTTAWVAWSKQPGGLFGDIDEGLAVHRQWFESLCAIVPPEKNVAMLFTPNDEDVFSSLGNVWLGEVAAADKKGSCAMEHLVALLDRIPPRSIPKQKRDRVWQKMLYRYQPDLGSNEPDQVARLLEWAGVFTDHGFVPSNELLDGAPMSVLKTTLREKMISLSSTPATKPKAKL